MFLHYKKFSIYSKGASMDKPVFSATYEMARAFESVITQGIMNLGANPATAASWWRNKDNFLFAAQPTTRMIPGCRHVQIKLDWDGYYPAA